MRRSAIALLACFVPACGSAPKQNADSVVVAAEDPALSPRLAQLMETLEERRQSLNIPGMAIAVVMNDEVVLVRGFGLADLESQRPVTPDTIFAIGSTTKAFTTGVISTLVDEGRLSWDDPVTKYLPYYTLELDTDDPNAELTIADLCSHRSGFTRMSVAWASGKVPREEILRTAARAEAWDGFREDFHYNNVMYLAAGMAAGKVAGSSWDELVQTRILDPLGMDDTTLSVEDAQRDPRLASGYLWDSDLEEHKLLPMRELKNIAPAGSINSSVVEMAQWLRLMLGQGEYEGQQIIDSARFDELWSEQIDIAPGVDYGLGWMLQEWEDRKVVEHGGNIDGFAAEVGLLPEENLGFVLLTNVSSTPLQQGSLGIVWEALLGEQELVAEADAMEAAAEPAANYDICVGEYQGSFGGLAGQTMTVQVKEGHLAVDVPGQMLYDLKEPDAEGNWYFEMTDAIAVSFAELEDGKAQVLVFHQGGLDIECPRFGWEYPIEIPLDELELFLGRYQVIDDESKVFEVVIKNNHIAIDVPGQTQFELHMPDEDGNRFSRITSDFGARFEEEGGRVVAMTLLEGGSEGRCRRLDAEESLPTLAEFHELRGNDARRAAVEAAGTVRMIGQVRFAQAGVEGLQSILCRGMNEVYVDINLGRFGRIESATNGERSWSKSTFEPFTELHGDRLAQALHGTPASMWGDWSVHYEVEELTGRDEVRGRKTIEVMLKDGDLPPAQVDVDAETGDVLQWREPALIPAIGSLPIRTDFFDYREVHGLRIPHRMEVRNDANGVMIFEVTSVDTGVEASDSDFELNE